MTKAAVCDIIINQGSTFEQIYKLKTGSTFDFTNYTARAQLRTEASSKTILATFTCTIVSSTELKITLSSAQTTGLVTTGKNYKETTRATYDIELVKISDSTVLRIVNGIALISPEVTK